MGKTPHGASQSFRIIGQVMNDSKLSPAGQTNGAPPSPPPGPSRRVLVVDDDPFIRKLNTKVLARFGYQVDAAEDGAAAWQALNRDRYDLLITDHNMPKTTGIELLQKLHGARMTLPVIMTTGMFPEDEFAQHPWLQPAATLLKPFTTEELLNTVKKVLHTSALPQAQANPFSRRPVQPLADPWLL